MRWLLAIAAVIGLPALAAASHVETGSTVAKNGNTYTARHVIHTSLKTPALLSICFDFKHLQGFYLKSEVKLLKSGQDWQTVEYRTDYKISTSAASYRKVIDRANRTIRFTMLDHQVTGWGIPIMTASSGNYTISEGKVSRNLVYEQSVTLNREISTMDWAMIQRETRGFFTDFETYIRKQEAIEAASDTTNKIETAP